MRRTITTILAGLLAVASSSQTAWSQDVEELAREGAELFQAGDFRQAAIVLQQAYDAQAVPVLLYNIARAYQQDGRCYMASQFFGRYLDSGDEQALTQAQQHEPGETACANQYSELISAADDALNRGQLDRSEPLLREALELSDEPAARIMLEQTLFHLGRCEEARDYIASVSGESDFTSAQAGELDRDLTRAQECLDSRRCTEERATCEEQNDLMVTEAYDSFNSRRTVSYIVGGSGAAVLLGAVIHDAVSQSLIDDYERAVLEGDLDQATKFRDDIGTNKTISWILYGVGGAALITGVVLFFTASSPGDVPTQDCNEVCWDFGVGTPTGHTGVWLGGTF